MKKRLWVENSGGLGNQLFSYFFALYVKSLIKTDVGISFLHTDRSEHHSQLSLLDFDISPEIHLSNLKNRSLLYKTFQGYLVDKYTLSDDMTANPELVLEIIKSKGKSHIRGNFGSFFYFDQLLEPQKTLLLKQESSSFIAHSEMVRGTKSIAVHHRLGDYLDISSSVGLLGPNYYKFAIQAVGPTDKIFVFSNDPEYSETLFHKWGIADERMTWIKRNYFANPGETLMAMSRSSSIICSNSTFSFWAAKLGSSNDVIAPAQFRRDALGDVKCIPKAWTSHNPHWIDAGEQS